MPGIVEDRKGVSLLVEYLILMGIISVFVVLMSLQLHETLAESQISRVMVNHFTDVVSQVSAVYTDYILLLPSEGQIVTKVSMMPEVGDRYYYLNLSLHDGVAYVSAFSHNIRTYAGLGYNKFLSSKGTIEIGVSGEVISSKERSEIVYKKEETCPFVPKIRLSFNPASAEFGNTTNMIIGFENQNEITKPVSWRVTLWNGTGIPGNQSYYVSSIKLTDISGCLQKENNPNDYLCIASAYAWISEIDNCSSSVNQTLLVSTKPVESNPYLVYEKWVEPSNVSRGEKFHVYLRLEGRGFFVEGVANLSVVHVIDVSGSMIWPTIFKNFSLNVNPNVIREEISLNQSGKLEIYAYTTSKLPSWYNSSMCKCSGTGCPSGYDSSLIRLYLNGQEVGSAYTSGSAVGKIYTNNNAQAGNYTIEVVAAAPEQIDITLRVVFRNNEILNKTVPYLNRQEVSFELPSGVSYKFLAISGIQYLPNWDMNYRNVDKKWSEWNPIESYTVSGQERYWDYRWRQCGDRTNTFQQGSLNVWLILPYGSKEFLMKGENQPWYQGWNNYGTNGINADAFIVNPSPGEYKFVVVPTTKNPTTFTATALIKRIDAAKLAGITFNSMLGEKDFVGIANFSTDGKRIAVNSSPLRFMTTDKSYVNSIINQQRAELATDHADGLYYGSRIFPIWNEAGNNCTDCIAGTRPLIIMLTDGEPTICNLGANYYGCNFCNQDCSGGSWCEPCKNQALCIANYLKNATINDFNISICTIGFSTDIGGRGQQFLREMASPRPDTGEPCYFFATTSEELVEAYRTIFNAFQIAAKRIIVRESLNVSVASPFEFLGAEVKSNKGTPVSMNVEVESNRTVITLNISSIQKDEVIELVVTLKVKDDAPTGTHHDVNIDNDSFIEYTALDNRGNELDRIRLPLTSDRDRIRIEEGDQPEIIIR